MTMTTPPTLVTLIASIGISVTFACGNVSRPAVDDDSDSQCITVWHRFPPSPSDQRLNATHIRSITPEVVWNRVTEVLYAESADLNCDGEADYLAQVVASSSEPPRTGLALVAFLRDGDEWEEVLFSPSPVDGMETMVIAADLTANGHLDIVTWGADEGGFVPRVFLATGEMYLPLQVSDRYTLRFEEGWDAACRTRVQPRLGDSYLLLSRETIPPTDLIGHGTECDLPTDTFAIQGTALIPVSGK
jgi:hypothetical protein